MEQVIAGEMTRAPPILGHSPQIALRRIFESEDIGLYHLSLTRGQRVPIGHDDLATVVLCLAGHVVLIRNGEVLRIEVGSYAIIPEGATGALAASDEPVQLLLFAGLDQLAGAFFNSYGAANV
jgi:hypothetical protein